MGDEEKIEELRVINKEYQVISNNIDSSLFQYILKLSSLDFIF